MWRWVMAIAGSGFFIFYGWAFIRMSTLPVLPADTTPQFWAWTGLALVMIGALWPFAVLSTMSRRGR